jgi:hypothetical protein
MSEESAKPEVERPTPADLLHQQTEFLNQFFRGMLLLNGGASVALLALVQAAWDKLTPSFIRTAVVCTFFLLAGLVCSAVSQYGAFKTSHYLQSGRETLGRRWQRLREWLVWGSIGCFILGVGIILIGLWSVAEFAGPASSRGKGAGFMMALTRSSAGYGRIWGMR